MCSILRGSTAFVVGRYAGRALLDESWGQFWGGGGVRGIFVGEVRRLGGSG